MQLISLSSFDIRLIPISEEVVLFFHAKTLQLYPLKDKRIIDFLEKYERLGLEETQKIFRNNEFSEIYNFICSTIKDAPKTTNYQSLKTGEK